MNIDVNNVKDYLRGAKIYHVDNTRINMVVGYVRHFSIKDWCWEECPPQIRSVYRVNIRSWVDSSIKFNKHFSILSYMANYNSQRGKQ